MVFEGVVFSVLLIPLAIGLVGIVVLLLARRARPGSVPDWLLPFWIVGMLAATVFGGLPWNV